MTITTESRAWRSAVISRAAQLRTMAATAAAGSGVTVGSDWTVDVTEDSPRARRVAALTTRVMECAAIAEAYAAEKTHPRRWLTGSAIEGAWVNLHAAEEHLVELLPQDQVRGHVPLVVYQSRRFLRPRDPRRVAVEARWRALQRKPKEALSPVDRTMLGVALRGVHYRNAVGFMRVRSLRNLQLGFAAFFVLLAVALGTFGALRPGSMSLCLPKEAVAGAPAADPPAVICPTGKARPTGGDAALVEVVGLLGAAIAAARAVTGSARPSGPYSTVVGQALLKTVLGSLTALVGVWFLRAGFVPGIDDIESPAEILVYAVVFGYAQQLLTQLIDTRADAATHASGTAGGVVPPDDRDPDVDPDPDPDPDPTATAGVDDGAGEGGAGDAGAVDDGAGAGAAGDDGAGEDGEGDDPDVAPPPVPLPVPDDPDAPPGAPPVLPVPVTPVVVKAARPRKPRKG